MFIWIVKIIIKTKIIIVSVIVIGSMTRICNCVVATMGSASNYVTSTCELKEASGKL